MTKYLRAHSLVSLLDARDGEKVGRKYALPRPDVLHSSHTWSVHLRPSAVTPRNEDRQDGVLGWCFKLSALPGRIDVCWKQETEGRRTEGWEAIARALITAACFLEMSGGLKMSEDGRDYLRGIELQPFLKGLSIYLLLTVWLQQRRSQSAEGAR